ncbi:hypothetical protein GCK32_020740, partial [Trichostrongylus colubriformis]
TVFLIDKGSLSRELSLSRTAAPLNEIAAASNGHFIVSDQGDATNFIKLLNMLYASGPSQSLLFARSMRYVATVTNLGTLEIGEDLQVTITATTSIYDILRVVIGTKVKCRGKLTYRNAALDISLDT